MDHVAFIRPEPLAQLVSGKKAFEVRLGKRRTCVWDCSKGDRVLIKESMSEIKYATEITEVHRFTDLVPEDISALRDLLGTDSPFEAAYWNRKTDATRCIAIRVADFVSVSFPHDLTPRGVQVGWVSGFEHFDQMRPKPRASSLFGFPL